MGNIINICTTHIKSTINVCFLYRRLDRNFFFQHFVDCRIWIDRNSKLKRFVIIIEIASQRIAVLNFPCFHSIREKIGRVIWNWFSFHFLMQSNKCAQFNWFNNTFAPKLLRTINEFRCKEVKSNFLCGFQINGPLCTRRYAAYASIMIVNVAIALRCCTLYTVNFNRNYLVDIHFRFVSHRNIIDFHSIVSSFIGILSCLVYFKKKWPRSSISIEDGFYFFPVFSYSFGSDKTRYCLNWVHRKRLGILFVQQLTSVFFSISFAGYAIGCGSWFHLQLTNISLSSTVVSIEVLISFEEKTENFSTRVSHN